jgi:hypothetical protein
MKCSGVIAVALLVVVLSPTAALPHHSNVAYEVTKVITITGVVKSFEWVNPSHVAARRRGRWQGWHGGVGV